MSQDDDELNFDLFAKPNAGFVNQRRTVRYVRKDIRARIWQRRWFHNFGLAWLRRDFAVELLDISNRGCLIASPKKLERNDKIVVLLQFETGKLFEINASVVRKSAAGDEYGIQFTEYNDALGEYMLQTQNELLFK